MIGYAIFQIEITNPEEYKNYVAKASGIAAKYGGEYLVRGGDYECVEIVQMFELSKVKL